jgi:hypothetical protein
MWFATNNTRIRNEVLGKDLTDPTVRDALTNEANFLKSQKVKRGVTQLLEGVPSEQRRIPDRVLAPRKKRAVAARVGTGDAVDPASVEFGAEREDTDETVTLDGRTVGGAGRDADAVDVGKRTKRGALARKVKAKVGRKRTKASMSEIDPTTGDAEIRFPDGTVERVRREESVDPETEETDFSFISLDRPDPDFPADVEAPLLLGSTQAAAIKKLTEVREAAPVEPVRRATPEDIAGRRADERDAIAFQERLTTQKQTERAQRVAEGKKSKAETQERIKTADLRKVRSAQREAADRLEEIAETKAARQAKEDSVEILYAPTRTEIELDSVMPKQVQKALRNNELRRALLGLADSSNDKFIKRTAKKLADFTGDTRVQIVPQEKLGTRGGSTIDAVFVTKDNTILLSEDYLDTHVLLHEMTHAATINTLRNKAHPTTKQLNKLYEDTKDSLSSYYGSENVAEFVAEAFSNPKFQLELAGINPKGEKLSAWQRFLKTIMDFLKIGKLGPKTAQREASRMIEEILAPAARHRYGPTLRSMSDRDGVTEIGDRIKDSRRDLKSKEGRKAFGDKLARDFSAIFKGDSDQTKLGKKAFLPSIS